MRLPTSGVLRAELAEVFASIQGEGLVIGKPCVFVRFAGCNLRCSLCDTKYSWSGGYLLTAEELVSRVREYGLRTVVYTGGEPLLQPKVLEYVSSALHGVGYLQVVETNASIVPSNIDVLAKTIDVWSLSPKLPSMNPNYNLDWYRLFLDSLMQNLPRGKLVYVKFAVGRLDELSLVKQEYDKYISRHLDEDRVVLQPLNGSGISYNQLALEALRMKLNFRVLPQLHKLAGLR